MYSVKSAERASSNLVWTMAQRCKIDYTERVIALKDARDHSRRIIQQNNHAGIFFSRTYWQSGNSRMTRETLLKMVGPDVYM